MKQKAQPFWDKMPPKKNIEIQNSREEKNGSLIGEMPGMSGQRLISIQAWTNHQKSNISPWRRFINFYMYK